MVSKPKGNQAQMSSYFEPAAIEKLKTLSDITRVPQSVYMREALDDLLKKYSAALKRGKAS